MNETITYVCVTQNRVENLKRNLPVILPYVDRAVIIDGGSYDSTEEFCKSLSPKVEWYYRKWDDSFANQYNEYLKHITGGWVLLTDDDELPSEELLQSLRPLMSHSADGDHFSCVEFRSWSINADDEVGKDHPDDYWRKIFFRYVSSMSYTVSLHQCLVGYKNNKHIRRNEHYYHIKTQKDTARNACRNYFISGIWISGAVDGTRGPEWVQYRDIVSRNYPDVETFNDLDRYLAEGNIHPELKEWIIQHKEFGNSLYHELHHYYEYYFELLHPEEVTKEVEKKLELYKCDQKVFTIKLKSETWTPPGDSRELGVALKEVCYTLNGEKVRLPLTNPKLEISGFSGVEQVPGGATFSWSSSEATISVYGIDSMPDEFIVYLMWPVRENQRVYMCLDDKELPITGYGLGVRKKVN